MKKRFWLIASIFFLCIIGGLGLYFFNRSVATPTIMIPGTNGTSEAFDGLIKKLKHKNSGVEVVKLTVNPKGKVAVKGTFDSSVKHPVIVVAFEDASDPSLPQQAAWFQKALKYAQSEYHFQKFNCVGYSNGGLIATGYLENEVKNKDPKMVQLLTLGTPFNDVSWDYNAVNSNFQQPLVKSPLLKTYLKEKKQIPSDLKMINLSGNVAQQNTDLIVPLTSVLAGRLLYQKVDSYQEITLTKDADHIQLVQNQKVADLIQNNFFK